VKGSVPEVYSIPPVLHASSKSRAEALRHYQLVMHRIDTGCTFDKTVNRYVSTWKHRWVYINFKVDHFAHNNLRRVWFTPDFFLPFQPHYLSQIRFLDIEFYGGHDLNCPEYRIVGCLLEKEKLEMVTLVARPISWGQENEVADSVGGHLKFDETKRGLLEKWAPLLTFRRVRSDWSPKLGCRLMISDDVELDPSGMDDSM
jgi:hypothetical protein